MAIQADKKAPESPSAVERILDFSGGLNSTISGSLLNKSEAQVSDNVSYEQKGTLKARNGRRKRYVQAFSPSVISGVGTYYKSDGTSMIVVASGDKLYVDQPQLALRWQEKADWEQEGVETSERLSTTKEEGSLALDDSLPTSRSTVYAAKTDFDKGTYDKVSFNETLGRLVLGYEPPAIDITQEGEDFTGTFTSSNLASYGVVLDREA